MLYVGYFRFDFDDAEAGASEGRFSYLIEAESVDDACQRMAVEIPERYGDLTMNTSQVFLDEIIEIDRLPESGLVLRAEHGPSHPDVPLLITLLPNQEGDGCAIFRQGPDPEEDLEAANAFEPEPFLVFDDVEEEVEEETE
jgi:hypothetical protein